MPFLKKIVLNNFRNYTLRSFDLGSGVNLIVGPNAIGKTTIVEAIHLLSTGESFRAGRVEEMVQFEQELGRVQGLAEDYDGQDFLEKSDEGSSQNNQNKLEVIVNNGMVQGKKTQKRLFSVNDVRRRKKDFVAKFLTTVFRPEDMRLIEGSKSRRRNFMDETLSVLDWQYGRALKMYGEALTKRNKVLWQVREGLVPKTTLKYWEMTMIKHGEMIQNQRQKLLDFFREVSFPLEFGVLYQPSIISEERIDEYRSRAIAAGHSLVGPHKDDFEVILSGKKSDRDDFNVAVYGSRGQQRMAVLWLKICQVEYLEKESEQKVLLLLDDILSELDEGMQDLVLGLLEGRQSVVTSADEEVKGKFEKEVFELIKI